VTLSVGLQEAELLSLSSQQGTLSLALRGHQDLETVNGVPEVTMKDIWERERQRIEPVKTSASIKAIERIRKR
jgi:Flp pilus assembly protein CpaB